MLRIYRLLFIVAYVSLTNYSGAQTSRLKDIVKFEFYTHGGGLSSYEQKFEIRCDSSGWNCYRTLLVSFDVIHMRQINTSERVFIKNIPAAVLTQLLDIIARRDTAINIKLFKVDTAKLIRAMDSLATSPSFPVNLTSIQRVELIGYLRSEKMVNEAFVKALHPRMIDDRSLYRITITNKLKDDVVIEAYSFAATYNLPWLIGGKKVYDPNISLLFALVSYDKRFARQQYNWLHEQIVHNLYSDHIVNKQ